MDFKIINPPFEKRKKTRRRKIYKIENGKVENENGCTIDFQVIHYKNMVSIKF